MKADIEVREGSAWRAAIWFCVASCLIGGLVGGAIGLALLTGPSFQLGSVNGDALWMLGVYFLEGGTTGLFWGATIGVVGGIIIYIRRLGDRD